MVGVVRMLTPLCPAGHLPLKGGDWLVTTARPAETASRAANFKLKAELMREPRLISPLEGEMPGRAEGGNSLSAPMRGMS